MDCPHLTVRSLLGTAIYSCAILERRAGINVIAGPESENHYCNMCKPQWTNEHTPPDCDTLTPVLASAIDGAVQWDESQPCRGLGDIIAKGLALVGIKRKKRCGCRRRQAKLNRLFPLKRRSSKVA